MKKNLLKSVLLALMVLVGGNAWAQTTTLLEYGTENVAWTAENLAEWTAGGTPTITDGYVGITGGNGSYATSITTTPTENAIINVQAVWRGRSNTGRQFSNGNGSYFRFGNIVVAQNDQTQKHGYTFKGLDDMANVTQFAASPYRQDIANLPWLLIEMEINTASNTVKSLTVKSEDGATTYASVSDIVLENADYTTIAFGYRKSGSVSTSNAEQLKSVKITQTVQAVETANYTVKFVCNGTEVKEASERTGVVGQAIVLTSADIENFYANDMKYIYVSSDMEDKTINADNSTIVTVTFREAEKFAWTAKSNVGNYTISGETFEGDKASVKYPFYQLHEGKLWKKEATSQVFAQSFDITENNQELELTYTETDINAIYYAEIEDIEGMTSYAAGNAEARSSQRAAGYSAEGNTKITSLAKGKYKLVASFYSPTSAGGKYNFFTGSRNIWSITTENANATLGNADVILAKENNDILLGQGSYTQAVDYIYIQQLEATGEELSEAAAADEAADAAAALATAKAALQAAIDAIPADLTIYTETSVQKVNTAKAAAEAELANAEATVESLTTAKTNLEAAVAGLKKFIALPEGDLYIWSAGAENGGEAVASDGESVGLSNAGNVTIRLNGAKDFSSATVTITLDNALQANDTLAVTAYRNKDTKEKKSGIKAKFDKGGEVSTSTGFEFININAAVAEEPEYGTEPNTIKLVVPEEAAGSTTITMTRAETATNLFITKFEIIKNVAEENFEPVDCTAKVDANGWKSDIGSVGNYTKDVAQKEQYLTNTTTLGQVLYQTVEGLDNGTYTVELYANASYTSGRGFTSAALNNEVGRAIVYAGDVEKTIPVVHQTAVGENNIVTLENVVVSDGTLKMGLRKDIEGSNWHTIQIKALTQTSDKAKADAAAQDEYWKGIAATVAAYEAYVNVAGAEKAAIAAAETKAAAQAAIAPFYAAKASYDNLVQAIADADAAGVDAGDAKAVLADAKTTAEKATEAYHAVKLAINTKAVEGASASNPIVTNFVVNGTFDTAGNIAPWKTTGGFQNQTTATNQSGAFTVPFFENWNGSAKANKMYQEIEDIPNGNYTLKIAAFVNTFDAATQYVFANADHVALTSSEPTAYEVNTIVSNNKIEIGLEQTAAVANWMGIDNVSLVYTGETNIEELVAAYNEALTAAKAVEGKMNATDKAALDAAIAAEVDKTNAKALAEATTLLQTAASAAKASVTAYAAAADKLAKMKALTEETNVYTAEALEEYYGQWAAKYEAATLTTAEANALQDPNVVTAWHAAITVDNFLLSAWDTNPDFVDAPYYINTWSTEGNNDGSEFKVPFFEYWTGDGDSLGEKTLTATMSNLEAGDYDVTAWVRVRIKNGAEAPAAGITLQANDGEAANASDGAQVGTSQFYLKEVAAKGTVASDGVLKIKFIVAADNNISWLSFKNVKFEKQEEAADVETGNETSETATGGGSSNAQVNGESYFIAGTYIAGAGSAKTGNMASKGFKLRTGTDGSRAVFTVNEPYTITSLVLEGASNYAKKDGAETNTKVVKVEVDGVEVPFTGGNDFQYRGENGATSCNLTIANIKAKESIAIYFDNSGSTGSQLNVSYAITWQRPMATKPAIELTKKTLALVPGSTFKLEGKVDPAKYAEETTWVSDNESVATVAADGTVTAVAEGSANISLLWKQGEETVADTAVVTVNKFNSADFASVKTLDLASLDNVTLTIQSEAAGNIWNEGNNKPNPVYFVTNEGLTDIAVQAVESGNKGWSIVANEGLKLASGAGRCAAIGNLKKDEVVEIIYTGNHFYTGSREDAVRKDDGALKTALNEAIGHAIYQMNEDGMLGFELDKGSSISKICIYSTVDTGINTLKAEIENGSVYNLNGQKVEKAQKGLYIINGKKVVIK